MADLMGRSGRCFDGDHPECRFAKTCECICHRKDEGLSPAADEARIRSETFALRWAAHQAVKRFDLKPNLDNATAAVEALNHYITQLNNTNDRGPE